MSLVQRFSAIDKAALLSIGNSMVVCGSSSEVDVNTSSMVKVDGTPTNDWTNAGSSAILTLPLNSTVLYAELIWYSTVASSIAGTTDVRSIQDNAIRLSVPGGATISITPSDYQSYTASTGSINRFRTAVITSTISQYGNGTYTVANVPTSIPSSSSTLSDTRAGWILVIAYRNDAITPQQVGFESGIQVATNTQPIQESLIGFTTSSDESLLKGNIFMAVANGEPLAGVEAVSVGPSFASLTTIGNPVGAPNKNPLTSPNNPYNNMFSGQINICDPLSSNMGLLNINGTNGLVNHDAYVPKQEVGARNKWDMTMIDISNTLVPNQTMLAGQLSTQGTSSIEVLGIGSQVRALAPDMTAIFKAYDTDGDGEFNVQVGDEVIYTLSIKNNGAIDANNVRISLNNNSYSSVVPNSVMVNNVVQTGANLLTGINLGTISAYGVCNVTFAVVVNSLPPLDPISGNYLMYASMDYSYQFVSGINTITNYANSNTIAVIVQAGEIGIVNSVSKLNAFVGDSLTYTSVITNQGTQIATDVFFQNELSSSCSFNAQTVTVDGIAYSDYDPTVGFDLSDIPVNGSVTVTFSVTINTLPSSTKVKNASVVSFGYYFNQYLNVINKTVYSNYTSVQIQYTEIIGERSNNNNYPLVNQQVIYTLTLTNVGNIPASGVQVLEPLIPGASFVAGTVTINGITNDSLNPFTGFTLQNAIQPSQTTTVTYTVLINQVQPGQTVDNIAKIPFKYIINPTTGTVSTETDSNMVETRANYVCMNIVETVDKAYAQIGDTLYYTVKISNDGNIDATSTMFYSQIQSDTTFVINSVAINGIIQPDYDPNVGFTIGRVAPSDMITVTYQALVKEVPSSSYVYNSSNLEFSYLPDPTAHSISSTITSNRVETIINQAAYTVTKSVDKSYAVVGDKIVYTTVIQNTGTVSLTNVSYVDNLAGFLQFYPGTVFVNGQNYPNYDPNVGFNISTLHPQDSAIIVFGCTIVSSPDYGYVLNTSLVTLSYQVAPTSPVITKTVPSNTVQTFIVDGNLAITKAVDKAYAKVGDVLTYSFAVSNIGNVPLSGVEFVDTVPIGGTFVPDSVVINGISKTYNPNDGFSLGALNVGQVITVSFKASVTSVPTPNTMINTAEAAYSYSVNPSDPPQTFTATSNRVTTVINKGDASLTKAVNKLYATVGDTLTYTITVNNTGTVALHNVVFADIVQNGASFIADSVTINGTQYIGYNPVTGFSIGTILASGDAVVTFQVMVVSVPTPPTIINTASIAYEYYIDPNGSATYDTRTSNYVTTNINKAMVSNTKSVDKLYATVGDTLTYTSVISNTGNVNISNTNFVDLLASDLSFVSGSVTINGSSTGYDMYDPTAGFTIGTVLPNASVTVTFQAKVNTLPGNGTVVNSSNIYYSYYIDPTGSRIDSNTVSNLVTTYIKVGTITFNKTADRMYARINDIINYTAVITNTGNTVLKNLFFSDVIQQETTFNAGSVVVNNQSITDADPSVGFALSDIAIGGYTTITFAVTVNAIPLPDGIVSNEGNVTYSYYINPDSTPVTVTTTSTKSIVTVLDTIISATKAVDKSIAKINDTLDFTIDIYNYGTATATNVVLKDILVAELELNTESVYVGGTQVVNPNLTTGITIPDIPQNGHIQVVFAATILTKPSNNIITNNATITYSYVSGSTTIDGSMTTNTTQTYVATGQLTLTKSVNKTYATIGDIIGYTILVQNTGSVTATTIQLTDLIQSDASFNSGSVTIDGVPYTGSNYNPNTGIALTDLQLNQSHTVTFTVTMNQLPTTNEIDNTATASFQYQLIAGETPQTGSATSNTVQTYINLGILLVTKGVDKLYATIGDTVNYTITVKNQGNVSCTQVMLNDLIQSDATFTAGTVVVNGTGYSAYNPNNGFSLPDIAAGATVTVSFAVTVKTLPGNYILYNTATVNYKTYVDPNPQVPLIPKTATSNTVATQINVGTLTVTKAASKAYATIADAVTYTVTIVNTGNVVASAINFRDIVPVGLTFTTGTVSIDGTKYPTYNPYQSFGVPNLNPGDSVVVTFDTTVSSLPDPSLVTNTANVTFSYYIDPTGTLYVKQTNSNTVSTQINVGTLSITKAVDKAYATAGDTLTYSFVVTNTGNVNLSNVTFIDNLQADVTFNATTFTVNGTAIPSADPTVGVNLGTIPTLTSLTVSFTVTVIQTPMQSSVIDFADATFAYLVDPNGQTYNSTAFSNTVYTTIIMPGLTGTTTVDLLYATLQDTLNYTVVFKNTGNTKITDLFFTDTYTSGGTFVPSSVIVDGVSYQNYDPVTGFNLPDLIPGNTTQIQFKVKVTSLPTPPKITQYGTASGYYKINPSGANNPISATTNTVTTYINVGSLQNTKSVDKLYASIGDTLTYTTVILNNGNVLASSIAFSDNLQNDVSFVGGTVRIDGVLYPALDPILGFSLANLAPLVSTTITFDVVVNTLPIPPVVNNTSQVQFNYYIDPTGSPYTKTTASNEVTTNIVKGQINSTKVVDKSIATIGDILTYTVTLINNGNVVANSVFFQDTPSAGATFNLQSVTVNGVSQTSYNPSTGFMIGDIGIGQVVTVVFTATVVSVPSSNKVTNQAISTFEFVVDPKQQPYTSTSYSNTVTTNIAVGSLSVTKSVDKNYATIGDILTYTITVTNTGNIDATNVQFLDPTPNNAVFVTGTVTVNGLSQPTYNPAAGFPLNTMTPGQIITVVYKVQVLDMC